MKLIFNKIFIFESICVFIIFLIIYTCRCEICTRCVSIRPIKCVNHVQTKVNLNNVRERSRRGVKSETTEEAIVARRRRRNDGDGVSRGDAGGSHPEKEYTSKACFFLLLSLFTRPSSIIIARALKAQSKFARKSNSIVAWLNRRVLSVFFPQYPREVS